MDPSNVAAQHLILLVDDAEDCLSTLDLALGSLPSVVVRAARTAEDAVSFLATAAGYATNISAVVTDIHLPRMSGLELIAHIRSQPRWQGLPIVALSADTDPDTPQRALRLGADAYFPKPFSPGAVRKKLEELIHA
ncbi:MAG TPA: response regulator [Bryobacteraceae bacterium]|nr:response regulator [Bryobacteraceae bacterium]